MRMLQCRVLKLRVVQNSTVDGLRLRQIRVGQTKRDVLVEVIYIDKVLLNEPRLTRADG